jgi:hypothetical protein
LLLLLFFFFFWLKSGYDMYWDCFVAIFGGVVGLKGAGHGGMDLKWAGHVGGVSLSHLGSKKFTRWYSVVFSMSQKDRLLKNILNIFGTMVLLKYKTNNNNLNTV